MQWVLAHLQPGPHFSEQRKMLRRGIGPQRVGSHDEKIEKNTIRLMPELGQFGGSPRSLIQRSFFTFFFWFGRMLFTDMPPIHISRTVGRSVVEVAYGEKILGMIGDELLSWNSEEMHLYEDNFVKFWFVDIFNFRSSMFPCLGVCSLLTSTQSVSSRVGFREPVSGTEDPPIVLILPLTPIIERLASVQAG
jgi:hypothetical protein